MPKGLPFRYAAALGLWAAFLYGWNLGGARALTWHEIHMVGGAKQMLAEGNWWMPRIGDHYWLEKPLLPYWATMACGSLFGFGDAAVRLPFAFAGIAVALLVADLSARWFGPTVGLLAGLLQACSVYMLAYARLAESDMMLAAFTVGGIYSYARWQLLPEPRSGVWRWSFWWCLGLANWSKGFFFGDAMVLAPIIALMALNRDATAFRRLFWWPGMLLAAALLAAWPVAVWLREPSALALWKYHLFDRATGTATFNNEPWWYYLVHWPYQLAPGTAFLLAGWAPAWRRAAASRTAPERFLFAWLLVPAVLLSIPSGKHHHYLIHALPAAAPIMAFGVVRWAGWLEQGTAWAQRLANAAGLAGLLLVGGAAWPRGALDETRIPFAALGAATLAAAFCARRRRPMPAFAALAAGLTLAIGWAHQVALPNRDPSAADRDFLARAARLAPADAPVFGCGGAEVARYIVAMPQRVQGVWELDDLRARLPPGRAAYVLARVGDEARLAECGPTTLLDRSPQTRLERGPADRHALFRIDVPAELAGRPR